MKLLIAALSGGLTVMVIAFALHRPPIDELGWSKLSHEETVRTQIDLGTEGVSGIYNYPSLADPGLRDERPSSQTSDVASSGSSGFIVHLASGQAVDPAHAIMIELVKTLLVALFATILVARIAGHARFSERAFIIFAIATTGSVATHISYYAWFGFPAVYTIGRIFLDVTPWAIGSMVIAVLTRAPWGQQTAGPQV